MNARSAVRASGKTAGAAGGATRAPPQAARMRATVGRRARMRREEGSAACVRTRGRAERWPRAPSASSGVLAVRKSASERRETLERVDAEEQTGRLAEGCERLLAKRGRARERRVQSGGAPFAALEQRRTRHERVR